MMNIKNMTTSSEEISAECLQEWRPVVGYEGLYEVSDWGQPERKKQTIIMKLKYDKQVIEQKEVEIELPAFFESYGTFAMLKVDGTVVKAARTYIHLFEKEESAQYNREVNDLLTRWKPSTADEFALALTKAVDAARLEIPAELEPA